MRRKADTKRGGEWVLLNPIDRDLGIRDPNPLGPNVWVPCGPGPGPVRGEALAEDVGAGDVVLQEEHHGRQAEVHRLRVPVDPMPGRRLDDNEELLLYQLTKSVKVAIY